MKRYYLVGHGIHYSLSPHIYNRLFSEEGIEARYDILDVPAEEDLLGTLERLRRASHGFNVTIPYKRSVHALVDRLGDEASPTIGGVNTVLVESGVLTGYNTDWIGFKETLEEELAGSGGVDSAVLIGYGGAARAALYALMRLGFKRVHIMGRSPSKARILAAEASAWWSEWRVSSSGLTSSLDLQGSRGLLLVNATPMGSCSVDWLVDPCGLVGEASIVYDMVYYPVLTPLASCAQRLGIAFIGGLEMLSSQASHNLRLWLGLSIGWRRLYGFALERARLHC